MYDFKLCLFVRFKEKVNLNRPESPCNGDENSEAKEIRDNTVKGYLHGMEGEIECRNSLNAIPCMIPQAKDLLTLDEQKSLHQCSTLLQYNCMLERLMLSVKQPARSSKQCTTSSVSVGYEIYDDTATVRYLPSFQYLVIKLFIFMCAG